MPRTAPPDGEAPTVSGPKIRAAHGVGPVDRGVFMGNVPVSRRWIPFCYSDLADERTVGLARELHDFLEGLGPATCDIAGRAGFPRIPISQNGQKQGSSRQKL